MTLAVSAIDFFEQLIIKSESEIPGEVKFFPVTVAVMIESSLKVPVPF